MLSSRAQPAPAADEMNPIALPRPSIPASSIRLIMWRWPRKLIFSIPGVPSATPAHENNASTRPPHSSTAASIDALSARLTVIVPAIAGDVHRGEVHRHHFGTGVDQQAGGGVAHPGGGTDDHDALAVVAEQIEQGHGGTPKLVDGDG